MAVEYNTPIALAVPEGVMPMGIRRMPSAFGWRKYPVMTCTAEQKARGAGRGRERAPRSLAETSSHKGIVGAPVHAPNLVDKAIATGNDDAIRRRTVQGPHIFDSKAAVFSGDDGVMHFRQLEDGFHHVLNEAFGSAGAERQGPGKAGELGLPGHRK